MHSQDRRMGDQGPQELIYGNSRPTSVAPSLTHRISSFPKRRDSEITTRTDADDTQTKLGDASDRFGDYFCVNLANVANMRVDIQLTNT